MEQNKGWWLPERRLAFHRPLVDTTDMGSRIGGGKEGKCPPLFLHASLTEAHQTS